MGFSCALNNLTASIQFIKGSHQSKIKTGNKNGNFVKINQIFSYCLIRTISIEVDRKYYFRSAIAFQIPQQMEQYVFSFLYEACVSHSNWIYYYHTGAFGSTFKMYLEQIYCNNSNVKGCLQRKHILNRTCCIQVNAAQC